MNKSIQASPNFTQELPEQTRKSEVGSGVIKKGTKFITSDDRSISQWNKADLEEWNKAKIEKESGCNTNEVVVKVRQLTH